MLYERELNFLRDVFSRSRIQTAVICENNFLSENFHDNLKEYFENDASYGGLVEKPKEAPSQGTVYKLKDSLGRCYVYFLLPDLEPKSVLLIGPYYNERPSREWLLTLGERHGISPKQQRYFEEYILGIPELSEGNPLFLMIDRFCEIIWESPSFAIVELDKRESQPISPIGDTLWADKIDDVLVNVKAMEIRYAFENEMIRAVSQGQLHAENQLIAAFSEESFEKRVPDLLRNSKNYCIIMNTLLRKAAENGGVHPMYIDKVSSDLAAKIEQMSAASEIGEMMREMFRTYCRLVRKHALKHLSPTVQKVVLIIDSDLSAELSPGILAKKLSISLGYLCAVFKKETGKTVSEYIREKRIRHAIHLLSTTKLQVQTIALHCGIVDVQYFSKIFKKATGKTPKEYRETTKET